MSITKKGVILMLTYILLVGIVIFIFSHSVATVEESAAESREVMEVIEPILEVVVGKDNVTDHMVRKLAHFTEFGVLGIVLCLLSLLHGQRPGRDTVIWLFAGVLIAMTDETIQIFSHRGSQVQDIWLDSLGTASGVLLMLAAYWIRKSVIMAKIKE